MCVCVCVCVSVCVCVRAFARRSCVRVRLVKFKTRYVVEDDQIHLVLLNRRSFFALCMGHDHAEPIATNTSKDVHGEAKPARTAAFSHSFELKMTAAAELYIARQELR